MNYQESREYIDKITREIPSVLGLEHMRELMKRLGNPQDDLKYVHVAGTNGKGSVIAFLYSASLRRFEVKIITYPSMSYSLAMESVKRPSSNNSRKKEKTGRVVFSNSSQSSTPTLLFWIFSLNSP